MSGDEARGAGRVTLGELCAAAGSDPPDVRIAAEMFAERFGGMVDPPAQDERSESAAAGEPTFDAATATRVALYSRLLSAGLEPLVAARAAAWAVYELRAAMRNPGPRPFDFPALANDGRLMLEVGDGEFVRMRRLVLRIRAASGAGADAGSGHGPGNQSGTGSPPGPRWSVLPRGGPKQPKREAARVRPVTRFSADLGRVLRAFREAAEAVRFQGRTAVPAGAPRPRTFPSDLTDRQWRTVAPRLTSRTGRPPSDPRAVVDAIRYREATACPWRRLPADFPAWEAVQSAFRRWTKDGTLARVASALRERRA